MPPWDLDHEYGFEIKGTKTEIDEVLRDTKDYDSTATLKRLDGQSFIYCDGDTAAMMCKLNAESAKLIRRPGSRPHPSCPEGT